LLACNALLYLIDLMHSGWSINLFILGAFLEQTCNKKAFFLVCAKKNNPELHKNKLDHHQKFFDGLKLISFSRYHRPPTHFTWLDWIGRVRFYFTHYFLFCFCYTDNESCETIAFYSVSKPKYN